MATKALDVFSMRDTVVREYAKFATSFTTIHAPDINEQGRGIYSKDRYWPEPLLQLNPHYMPGPTVAELAEQGVLVEEVLSTDFANERIAGPQPKELARAAIASAGTAPPGKDGITYLDDLMKQGICTPLTHAYCVEVLKQSGTLSLADALKAAGRPPFSGG